VVSESVASTQFFGCADRFVGEGVRVGPKEFRNDDCDWRGVLDAKQGWRRGLARTGAEGDGMVWAEHEAEPGGWERLFTIWDVFGLDRTGWGIGAIFSESGGTGPEQLFYRSKHWVALRADGELRGGEALV